MRALWVLPVACVCSPTGAFLIRGMHLPQVTGVSSEGMGAARPPSPMILVFRRTPEYGAGTSFPRNLLAHYIRSPGVIHGALDAAQTSRQAAWCAGLVAAAGSRSCGSS